MKKIGLVGGIGPASTVAYYLGLIERSRDEQGTYPEIVIDSVDMLKHDAALNDSDYDRLCGYLLTSLSNLKAAGAEIAAITANTEHIVWDRICDKFPVPVVSIVEATVCEIRKMGYQKVLVFGTAATLRSRLYHNALEQNGVATVILTDEDVSLTGRLIYPNLENGIVIADDRKKLIGLAEKYIGREHADALLLGCTELSLAVRQGDVSVPVLDTTQIHIWEIFREAVGYHFLN